MARDIFVKLDRYASFLSLVVIPFALFFIYYGLIASDRYTSEAIFTIKQNGNGVSKIDLGFLQMASPSGREDDRIIKEYLLSRDMLAFLDKKLNNRVHYDNNGDWFSTLSANATREKYLEYFRDHMNVHFDETTGLLAIEVQAFDREYARQLLETMLQQAERFVNEISHNLAMDQYNFLKQQLVESQNSLKYAKQNLFVFQNKHQIFSPEQQGESLTAIMGGLEAELTQEKAKLKQYLGFQKADSPQVISSRERIRALSEQIVDEKQRLVDGEGQALNDLMIEYTNLQLDLEFSKNVYASVMAALEQSRAEVEKKMKHLVVISQPSLAEEAKYPDRLYILVTALMVLLMIFGIARMSITTIKEHMD